MATCGGLIEPSSVIFPKHAVGASSGRESATRAKVGRVIATLRACLDWFVPREVRGSPDNAERARLATGVAWLMVPVFLVLAAAHAYANARTEAALNVVLAGAMAVAPFIFRASGRYFAVLNGALLAAYVAVCSVAVTERGAGISGATIALAELPLFATLLSGVRTGAVWAALSTLAIAGIGALGALGIITAHAPLGRLIDEHATMSVVTMTLFAIAALYESNRRQSLATIAELEQQRARDERERIEAVAAARVARAERYASLGRVAAAVGHEINNPLTYVTGNLEFVLRELAQLGPEPLVEALREAAEGVERIRRIVVDLSTYSRSEQSEFGSVDIERVLRTALQIVEGHTRSKARVDVRLPPLPPVLGNEARLTQVFMNLLVNASHGLPEGSAPENRISISAELPGEFVCIQIEYRAFDGAPDGVLPAGDSQHQPDSSREGIALGLALSEEIVNGAGGSLEFSTLAGSTTARVALRVSQAGISERPAPATLAPSAAQGEAQLLVIDDEPLVGRALQRTLRPHRVVVVSGGRRALELLATGEKFDMILCDLMMPDLSGMDVYERVGAQFPELLERIVFMTGGTFTERAEEFRASTPNRFIDKPLNTKQVRTLLAAYADRH